MTNPNRRRVLSGIALAPIAAPAALAQSPSEIMPLFRQWLTIRHADRNGTLGEDMNAEIDRMLSIEGALADLPATTLEELAAKMITVTDYGEWGFDGVTGEKLSVEVCALACAPALGPLPEPEKSVPVIVKATPPPVDPIVGWYDDWKVQEDICNKNTYDECPIYEAAWEERHRLGLLICNAKATTLRGALTQAEWFESHWGYIIPDNIAAGCGDRGLKNICASLKALVAEA